jgi:hypothetical protein
MRLISFGCSLTWGTDLPDCDPNDAFNWSRLTWPALLAERHDLEYRSLAHGGAGNLSVLDRALKWAAKWPQDMVIVNWTFADRFDYSNPEGFHFNNGSFDWCTCRPSSTDSVSDFYFRNLHSEYRDKLTMLVNIKATVDFLLAQKIKFLMTCLDDQIWCKTWHAPVHLKMLQQEIRPHILDFENTNFLSWSQKHGFDISASGHPLADAHAAAADLMTPAIDAILRRA